MSFSFDRKNLPLLTLSVLPFSVFLPSGAVVGGTILFFLCYFFSGEYRQKWESIRTCQLFIPAVSMTIVTLITALFLGRAEEKFWTGLAHYQIFWLLLLFASVGAGDWQFRAIRAFYAGAVYAASMFYLKGLSLLPDIYFFASYNVYGGNRSILIGVLMGMAASGLLHEWILRKDVKARIVVSMLFLYVALAMIFFAKSRTAMLVFVLLCLLVLGRHMTFSWRNAVGFGGAVILLSGALYTAPGVQSRLTNTIHDVQAFVQGDQISGEGVRLEFIRTTVTFIEKKPLFGHGIGMWFQEFKAHAEGKWYGQMTTPHNDYLLYAAELGLVGLGVLLWVLFRLFHIALKMKSNKHVLLSLFVAALIVVAIFNAALRDTVFGLPFMILIAVPLASTMRLPSSMQPIKPMANAVSGGAIT